MYFALYNLVNPISKFREKKYLKLEIEQDYAQVFLNSG